MTSSKYEYTGRFCSQMNSDQFNFIEDYLLCHDDDIHGTVEGRRIAFIYYLVPEDWTENDGGALDLFATNGDEDISLKSKVKINFSNVFCRRKSTFSYCEITRSKTKSISVL